MRTWVYNDGGRKAAGFKGAAGDCVCRAIAIALQLPYLEVYLELRARGKQERRRTVKRSSPRTGVALKTTRELLAEYGWEWVPVMGIGKGCTMHLNAAELPAGRIIADVSKHMVAVVDGVVQDTYDSVRDGRRCVYGYFRPRIE